MDMLFYDHRLQPLRENQRQGRVYYTLRGNGDIARFELSIPDEPLLHSTYSDRTCQHREHKDRAYSQLHTFIYAFATDWHAMCT